MKVYKVIAFSAGLVTGMMLFLPHALSQTPIRLFTPEVQAVLDEVKRKQEQWEQNFVPTPQEMTERQRYETCKGIVPQTEVQAQIQGLCMFLYEQRPSEHELKIQELENRLRALGGSTGSCSVPSDRDSRGRRCGGRAASSRPGGR